IPDFDVPANNFHLLPASTYEKFTQEKESYGATALLLQTVTLNADEVKKILWFSVALFSTK
ncbi:MAG: hypothetical protein NTY61_01000, partial [Candidatus Parcubacteria bacterium]|nr:hypothetical protein [Candidatus Parcubacteria bacterium]